MDALKKHQAGTRESPQQCSSSRESSHYVGKNIKVYLVLSLKNKNLKPLGKGQQTLSLSEQLGQEILTTLNLANPGVLPVGEGQDHPERYTHTQTQRNSICLRLRLNPNNSEPDAPHHQISKHPATRLLRWTVP